MNGILYAPAVPPTHTTNMQTSASPIAPFRAFVDQRLISVASSFFDNSMPSVIRELLQNSRRSGATRVDLWQAGDRYRYSDNGPGCEPQDLLGLGSSHWQEPVETNEAPAGCGFFALSRRNPIVICPRQGWKVELCEDHFNGKAMVEPQPYNPITEAIPESISGMLIEFDRGAGSDSWGIEGLARYMPLDFYINGKRQVCREDFMRIPTSTVGSKVIEFGEHITIRVNLLPGTSARHSACYGGHEVQLPGYDHQSFGTTEVIYCTQSSVEVRRERALPLELPQRNKMAVSEVTTKIRDLIHCAGLELAEKHLKEICIASPTLWTKGRDRGYTGAVLYTQFVGRQVVRGEDEDMTDYELTVDDDHETHAYGDWITFDQFEADGYLFAPDKDILVLLSQTTIPVTQEEGKTVYDLDTGVYYAPGLKLVESLSALAGVGYSNEPGAEGYEWLERLRRLRYSGNAWLDNDAEVHATGTTDDGKEFVFEGTPDGLDDRNLYDTIHLVFSSDDDKEVFRFPAAALFNLEGENYDTSIGFIATREWFNNRPEGFADTVAQAAYNYRECMDHNEEDDIYGRMVTELQADFAKFGGLDGFYLERFLSQAAEAVGTGVANLTVAPAEIVLRLAISSNGTYVNQGGSSCTVVPKFVPYYTFSGCHGDIACDENGNTDPNYRQVLPAADATGYPEYHSFDVPTMKQLGMEPGNHDIVDACGWHDSTRKIYVTPSIPHLLWTLGILQMPDHGLDSDEVRDGLGLALEHYRVGHTLYSALHKEHPQMMQRVCDGCLHEQPEPDTLWVYGT